MRRRIMIPTVCGLRFVQGCIDQKLLLEEKVLSVCEVFTGVVRAALPVDMPAIRSVLLQAFAQFEQKYEDWPIFCERLTRVETVASAGGRLWVATYAQEVVGVVAYLPSDTPRADFFQPQWAVMRLLAVKPSMRGHGVGRALALRCITQAQQDGVSTLALHTSPLMTVALAMYQRMGFRWVAPAPQIHGVEYGIYLKSLSA